MRDSRSRRGAKRRLLAEILIITAAVVMFGIVLVMFERASRQRESVSDKGGWNEENNEIPDQEIQIKLNGHVYSCSDQLESYLLIGTDNSGDNPEAVQGFNGNLADFLAVLLIDTDTGRHGLIQIDRDTMTDVPILDENGEEIGTSLEQLCTAHWYGQNEEQRNSNTVNTVSQVLGNLPIDGYYCLNMKDIPSLNHAVGGVSVTIEEDLRNVDPAMAAGTKIHLSDEQAEKFVRARMSVGDGTNISRMKRQRQYMENMYEQIHERFSDNAGYLNDLYKELKSVLDTDQPDKTVSRIASKLHDSENVGIMTPDGESARGKQLDDGEMHSEFYTDESSVADILGKIIVLRDITEEVITEEEMELLQEDFPEDEEIPSE